MKYRILLALLVAITARPLFSQKQLDGYIIEGLKSNEGVRQQNVQLEKSLMAIREAKSLFFPKVGFLSTYTIAGGGRTIDFPIGDLLNPVYGTLNDLTGAVTFPPLSNQSVLLNPDNFFDAKIQTTIPLINAEIIYNKRIRQQESDLKILETAIYKRELVKEIKVAYFNILQSREATFILSEAAKLAEENQRINTVLFQNDVINRTAVLRSNNELIKIEAQLLESKLSEDNARQFFNFLLNRPLDMDIIYDDYTFLPEVKPNQSADEREELTQLEDAVSINESIVKLAKSYQIPKLSAFMDLGVQTFNFEFSQQSPFYLGGLSLEWNLFSGNSNRLQVRKAQLDNDIITSQLNEVSRQLDLQLNNAVNGYNTALARYTSGISQVEVAEKYFTDVLKLYKQGQVLFLELLDAQNQLISSRLQANIALYQTWIATAEIERANASFNLNND